MFFCAIRRILIGAPLCVLPLLSSEAVAWSLKTHVWIAQQVLNDAADGSVVINGVEYPIPSDIHAALQAFPDRYRMGSLGPDVFPDPVVGQMTTHPGIDGGWQADEWLGHVLNGAKSGEEIAYGYGYVGHAAGDIFAHTFVNSYAGDIFSLMDGETEVELRHFVLEKYIESVTPPVVDNTGRAIDLNSELKSPTGYLRDVLILGGDVSRQNLKSKAGGHLTAMYEVRRTVENLQRETQNVIAQLSTWAADYFSKQIQLEIDLATAKQAVEAAKVAVKVDEALLDARRASLQAALDALAEAKRIVAANPGLITSQQRLLSEQAKVAADLSVEAVRIAADAASAVAGLESNIARWASDLGNLVCNIPFVGELPSCRILKAAIAEARKAIDKWHEKVTEARRLVAEAEKLRDDFKRELDRLQDDLARAEQGLANGVYDAAVLAAETSLRTQEAIVEAKRNVVAEAEKLQQKISNELDAIIVITAELKKAIDRYNPLTLLISKWRDDIDVASEEYIKASERAGLKMLNSSGNPLHEYTEWWTCYGAVFQAVPKEVGQAGCLARNYVKDVQEEVGRVIDDLPEIVRWIVSPTRELAKQVERKVRPELEKAAFQIVAFLTNGSLAEFLELLIRPENASREKLVDVYRRDSSGKSLIVFGDVATVVEKDLSIVDGKLTPENFPALKHAVTLAKLTLLSPDQLDRMVVSVSGLNIAIPEGGWFKVRNGRYSLLLNSVRSIDGNHQWQAYGLPYPKRMGVAQRHPSEFPYGRDGIRDTSKGLPIWSNVLLRERVFLKLFPSGVIGALGDQSELQAGNYRFPACKGHPYPRTQDAATGAILDHDDTCTLLSSPNTELPSLPAATASEYNERFFECGKPLVGSRHWTVVGSYESESDARRRSESIRASFPDMFAQAWRPQGRNRFWTVMIAACTTRDNAVSARDVAVVRGIARDAYVWRPSLPWEPGEN
ncbi:hypothetical protein [Rhizobium leguminosarum]|uniref:hypothetical protein n=1 Tax=Rhizobium leguminosarum TaxID=384 RepID=UPI0004811A89|nr:hypothetical protein [Rhizobium leguminosarum]